MKAKSTEVLIADMTAHMGNSAIRELCLCLGVVVHYLPPSRPASPFYKGSVERFVRELESILMQATEDEVELEYEERQGSFGRFPVAMIERAIKECRIRRNIRGGRSCRMEEAAYDVLVGPQEVERQRVK